MLIAHSSLIPSFYCLLWLVGPLDCILCPHRAVVYTSPCWLTNTCVSMCKSSLENVIYDFILAPPAVSGMFCSSYSDGL